MIRAHVQCGSCEKFIIVDFVSPQHEQDYWRVQLPPDWFTSTMEDVACSWECVLKLTKNWTWAKTEDREAFLQKAFKKGKLVRLL